MSDPQPPTFTPAPQATIFTPEAWAKMTGWLGPTGSLLNGLLKPLGWFLIVFLACFLAIQADRWYHSFPPGPGPVPPGPTPPGPNPPGPTPGPVTNPRVLFLYESADTPRYTMGQLDVLQGKETRDLLDTKLPMAPDGRTHNWREWDWDASPANEHQQWKDLMAKKPDKSKLPYVMIAGDNGIAYEGPLPGSPAEFTTLFNKYVK